MRLENEVKIQVDESTTKTYRVFELKPMDVIKIHEQRKDLMEMVREILPMASDIGLDDFISLYPNEQKKIFEAFKEVNAPFLEAAQSLGLTKAVDGVKSLLLNEFKQSVAASLKQAMPGPGSTEYPSSSGPQKNTTLSGQNTND